MMDKGKTYVEKWQLDSQLDNLYNSDTYKAGTIVLFIPRKIKGGIQCIKDHGFFYTAFYAIKKIYRCAGGK